MNNQIMNPALPEYTSFYFSSVRNLDKKFSYNSLSIETFLKSKLSYFKIQS